MKNELYFERLLDDYVDGLLSVEKQQDVAAHLLYCDACRESVEDVRMLLVRTAGLAKSIEPRHDLWKGIEEEIRAPRVSTPVVEDSQTSTSTMRSWIGRIAASFLVLALGAAAYFVATRSHGDSWDVMTLGGKPVIEKNIVEERGTIGLGECLETDGQSRALIGVGDIGSVEVEPNSRVKLLSTEAADHRLSLQRGTIHARIWAPPRLFFVETPSALAIDLGCAYTMSVGEDGSGVLSVQTGYVELTFLGRESVVPAAAMCVTRAGIGPGTPFMEDVGDTVRKALSEFDFYDGGSAMLDRILPAMRDIDFITLWHLLFRAQESDRPRIYDRLASLVPPPDGVSREGVLGGDTRELKLWREHLNLDVKTWSGSP